MFATQQQDPRIPNPLVSQADDGYLYPMLRKPHLLFSLFQSLFQVGCEAIRLLPSPPQHDKFFLDCDREAELQLRATIE